MSWDLNAANTNLDWVANGVLGKYTASKLGVYKCPADNYLNAAQRNAGWSQRNIRSSTFTQARKCSTRRVGWISSGISSAQDILTFAAASQVSATESESGRRS